MRQMNGNAIDRLDFHLRDGVAELDVLGPSELDRAETGCVVDAGEVRAPRRLLRLEDVTPLIPMRWQMRRCSFHHLIRDLSLR